MTNEEIERRVEKAKALFKQGFNCSQSVCAACADLYDMDEETALRVAASFGGGIGRMRQTCGAACGLFVLAGLENGSAKAGDAEGKKSRRISYLKSSQTSPAWSPRATEILFTSDRGGGPQIYVMGRDGSDVRRVTFMGRYNEKAAWSPTGDRIVYTSMDNGKMNIYTCAFDGSDIVQLTSNAGNNEHPTWSPDGNLIAFASDRSGTYQIYIMRRDGSNVTQITKQGENTSPTWSWYDSPPPTSKKEGKK